MENALIFVALVVYCVWSIRLGLRFVDGRWNVLEQPKNKKLKLFVSVVIGWLFGIVLIVLRIFKFMIYDFPRLLGM